MLNRYISLRDASIITGLPKKWLRAWCISGLMESVHANGKWFIRENVLARCCKAWEESDCRQDFTREQRAAALTMLGVPVSPKSLDRVQGMRGGVPANRPGTMHKRKRRSVKRAPTVPADGLQMKGHHNGHVNGHTLESQRTAAIVLDMERMLQQQLDVT